MKKILSTVLSLVFFLSICSPAFSANKNIKLFEADEITDVKMLYEKASKRETVDPDDINKFKPALDGAPGFKISNKKVTTQKTKEIQRLDGYIESFYVATTFADISKNDLVASSVNSFVWRLLAASKGWSEEDNSYSWRHVGTFTYSSYRDGNNNLWVRPESLAGKWYQLDSQVILTEGKYGMEWYGYNGSAYVGSNDYLYTPIPVSQGTTYTNACKSVGGNGYINVTPFGCYVAGVQQSKLKRNTTPWTFKSDYVFAENM